MKKVFTVWCNCELAGVYCCDYQVVVTMPHPFWNSRSETTFNFCNLFVFTEMCNGLLKL